MLISVPSPGSWFLDMGLVALYPSSSSVRVKKKIKAVFPIQKPASEALLMGVPYMNPEITLSLDSILFLNHCCRDNHIFPAGTITRYAPQ
jgi:hypothetical protein